MSLFYLCEFGEEQSQKRRAPGQIVELHVLVNRVRTIPARTESI
jgi:hypothetical protein